MPDTRVYVGRRRLPSGRWTYHLWWREDGKYRYKALFRVPPEIAEAESGPLHEKRLCLEADAQISANEHERRLANPGMILEPLTQPDGLKPISLRDAVREHMRWMRGARYGRRSWTTRERILWQFIEAIHAKEPDVARTDQLRQGHTALWRDTRLGAIADSTFQTEGSQLQGFLTWLRQREHIAAELIVLPRGVSRLLDTRPDGAHRRFLTADEMRAILRDLDPTRARPTACLAGLGMRIGEFAKIELDWWRVKDRVLRIPRYGAGRTKRHERDIPAGEYLAGLLDDARGERNGAEGNEPLFVGQTGGALYHQFSHWLRPFQVSPHDLRRWFNDTLRRAGCPREIRGALMGHTPSRRDGAYELPTLEELRPWTDRISEELCGTKSEAKTPK